MFKMRIDIVILILYLCGNSIGLDGNQIKYSMKPPGEHSVQLVTGGCFFMETKVCYRCDVEKPINEFGKMSASKDGIHHTCKKCRAEMVKRPLVKIADFPNELWASVTINNGVYSDRYKISNLGRLKGTSVPYSKTEQRERLITPTVRGSGYYTFCFRIGTQYENITIHRIVASAFIPNPENKPQVNHKNGIKTDNRVENLEWCTPSENMVHAVSNGMIKHNRGVDVPVSKLTESQVLEIRRTHIPHAIQNFPKKYGVSSKAIEKVLKRITWQHV